MNKYITVKDVDDEFGTGWSGSKDPDRCVLIANVWLTNKNLPDINPYPHEWILAGCEIAKEAANGNIYITKETGLLGKTVSADGVSSSKTFSKDYKKVSAGESLAEGLLKPWLNNFGSVSLLKKV